MFELLFKYPEAVFRNGTPVLLGAWPLWVLGAAVGALGLLWAIQLFRPASRRMGPARAAVLWALQTAFAGLVLLLLWRPAVQVASSRPQQNVVAVMVDVSRSMARDDTGAGPRIEAVRRALTDALLPGLAPQFRVRLYAFSDRARPVDAPPRIAEAPVTRVHESVAGVLRESRVVPMAGVIVLSDGADHSPAAGTVLSEIEGAGIPVHTVGVGATRLAKDVELVEASVPPRTAAGSRLRVTVRLRQQGLAGRTVRLAVNDGKKTVASRDVVLAGGVALQSEDVYVPAGEAGGKVLEVSLEPLADEEESGNNRLARPLLVDTRRARILYVEGEPRWELKFIRRAAEGDPGIELVTLLRTSPNKIYRQGIDDPGMLAGGFPKDADTLFAFDGLILGSVEAAYFDAAQQDLIRGFVDRRGGGLLALGGRRSLADGGWAASPVAEVLPVRLAAGPPTFARSPAEAVLTAAGRESPLCLLADEPAANARAWEELPALADHQTTGEAKPGAAVLLTAKNAEGGAASPLLTVQTYGRGRALAFATGGSWRWRMLRPHDDATHATFWRQLLRGLVAGAGGPVTAAADNALVADDGRARIRAEVRSSDYQPVPDARVWATVVDDAGGRRTVDLAPSPSRPGQYEADIGAPRPGLHRVEVQGQRGGTDLGRDVALVHRHDGGSEAFHPEQDVFGLQRLAAATGGRYWTPDQVGDLPGELAYSGSGITVRETLELWDMPAAFVLALALRLGEWRVRRAGGRV